MRVSKLALLVVTVAAAGCSGRVNQIGEVDDPGTGTEPGPDAGTGKEPGADAGTGKEPGADVGTGKEPDPGPTDGPGPVSEAPDCSSDPVSQRRLVFDSNREGSRDIYLMYADGSGVVNVTRTPDRGETDAELSPDGTQLVYVLNGTRVEVMNLETRARTPVAEGDQPTWSPDGSEIAFHHYASVFRIRIGEPQIEVIRGPNQWNAFTYPAYSPDGLELVMSRANQISATALDGTGERYVVGNTTVLMMAPDVAPNGVNAVSSIQCDARGFPEMSLWVSPFAATTSVCQGRRLTPKGPDATRAAWGPDDAIAFQLGGSPASLALAFVDAGALARNTADIALISAETGEMCVVRAGGSDENPSWVPDGFVAPSWLE